MAEKKFCYCGRSMILKTEPRCSECQEKWAVKESKRQKKYDENDRKHTEIYKNKLWKKVRRKAIERDHGLCLICVDLNSVGFVDEVHHIVTLDDDLSKAYKLNNLACLCKSHHVHVHEQYQQGEATKQAMITKLLELASKGGGSDYCVKVNHEDRMCEGNLRANS